MNKTKTLILLIFLLIILALGLNSQSIINLLKSEADLNPSTTADLFDNNPQSMPTQTGYLFKIQLSKILPLLNTRVSSDCLNNNNLELLDSIEWTATSGKFDSPKIFNSSLVALYRSPSQAINNVKVTAKVKSKPSISSTVNFKVTEINIALDQKPFPHISKHRIQSSANNSEIAPITVKYLEKYAKITVEGDNLKEAAQVKSQKSDMVNIRFTQSGTEIASRSFLLGLDPSTFFPTNYQKGDPINPLWLDQGKPYADQPWWGHLIYYIGAPLEKDLLKPTSSIYENLELTFAGDVTNLYQPGQYLVFFDLDAQNNPKLSDNKNIEMARVLPKINSKNINPVIYDSTTNQTTVYLESRGQTNVYTGDTQTSTTTQPMYTKTSLHKKGTLVRGLATPKNYPGGFRYNFSHYSLKPNLKNPEGLDSQDWFIFYLIHKLNRDLYSDFEYPATTINGWQFDFTPYWTWQIADNHQLVDLDLDNIADSGVNYLEFPYGQDVLGEGRIAFFQKLRNWAGENRLIIGDNHSNRGYDSLNGTEFEGFPGFLFGNTTKSIPDYIANYNAQLNYYRNLWSNFKTNLNSPLYTELFTKRTNAIFYNTSDPATNPEIPDMVRRQPTNNLFRLDTASAMLADGYYLYQQHPFAKIRLMDSWMDEFDGGLGSSLKTDVPKLTKKSDLNKVYAFDEVYQAFEGQFKAEDRWLIDQEEIEIVSFEKIGQDSLNNNLIYGKLSVYRGRNNSNRIEHPRGTKLLKLTSDSSAVSEVDQAGQGYLGKPLEDARNLSTLDNQNIIVNGNFDSQPTSWSPSTDTQLTVYDDRATFHKTSLEIKSTKLNSIANPSHPSQVFDDPNLSVSQEISMKRNTEYTLRFFAKAYRKRNVSISLIRQGTEDLPERSVAINPIEIHPSWREYQLSFVTPKGTGSAFHNYILTINGYREYDTFYLDNIRINKGGWHIYQREFEKGLVLINGTDSDVTFNLPTDKNFVKIKGTQDYKINDGSAVSGQYTVPTRDAIILLKQ